MHFFKIASKLIITKKSIVIDFAPCFTRTMSVANGAAKNLLLPPAQVRGMTELNRESFLKKITVPRLKVPTSSMERVMKVIKPLLLKMSQLQAVFEEDETRKSILLNPNLVADQHNSILRNLKEDLKEKVEFDWEEIELKYENYRCDDILDAVLPEEQEKVAGFSRIGHILHLNLREHLIAYRYLIGQVLLDKHAGIRTVVNKVDSIGNEFRTFSMEMLAGEEDYVALLRENSCSYQFDFSQVYWNSRLSTEHERLVQGLKKFDSVLYDMFAGVGPFAIPAARHRKARVLANDLNPHSFKWLQHNIKLNKVEKLVRAFNLDAREFVREVAKKDLIEKWNEFVRSEDESVTFPQIHFVMNLPALAVQFLDVFVGLLHGQAEMETSSEFLLPTVHCYMFIADKTDVQEPVRRAEAVLKRCKLDAESTAVSFVRSVAPNKEMMRISFKIPKEILFADCNVDNEFDLPKSKKQKLLENN